MKLLAGLEDLEGSGIKNAPTKSRPVTRTDTAIGSPENVDEAPVIVVEVRRENAIARCVDVRPEKGADGRNVAVVRVMLKRYAVRVGRKADELSWIVPDDVPSESDPVAREVCAAALRGHTVDAAMNLEPDARVDEAVDLTL